METLEFYGGVNEIGGNKIKLNLDSTSLLLDFGMSFSQAGKYFAEFMIPRKGNGLGDYLEWVCSLILKEYIVKIT